MASHLKVYANITIAIRIPCLLSLITKKKRPEVLHVTKFCSFPSVEQVWEGNFRTQKFLNLSGLDILQPRLAKSFGFQYKLSELFFVNNKTKRSLSLFILQIRSWCVNGH